MGEQWKMAAAGLLPLPAGYAVSALLSKNGAFPYAWAIGLAFFLAWGLLARALANGWERPWAQAVRMNSFGFIVLCLLLFQELGAKAMLANSVGVATQNYFLPFMPLVSAVANPALGFLGATIRFSWIAALTWVAMFLVGLLGARIKQG